MKNCIWNFSISYFERSAFGPCSRGVVAKSLADLEHLSSASGFNLKSLGKEGTINVQEEEESPRLARLLSEIERLYGFKPTKHRIVPKTERETIFGVQKLRQHTDQELNGSQLLYIFRSKYQLGAWINGSQDDVISERYIMKKSKKRNVAQFGFLSPFPAFGVTGGLKENLECSKLFELRFEPIVNGSDTWKLMSDVKMPQSLTRLQDSNGNFVEPDDWSDKWSDKYFDDCGYEPPELCYQKEEVNRMGSFDVAVTHERVGAGFEISFRYIVVSQRFRQCMLEFGVKDIQYCPIRLG